MTQNERILNTLRAGRTLTSAEASARLGIANLRARIDELRQSGVRIVSTPYFRKNGARAVKYSLARKTTR
jgi:predicted transcriptional regulator